SPPPAVLVPAPEMRLPRGPSDPYTPRSSMQNIVPAARCSPPSSATWDIRPSTPAHEPTRFAWHRAVPPAETRNVCALPGPASGTRRIPIGTRHRAGNEMRQSVFSLVFAQPALALDSTQHLLGQIQ